MSEPKPTGAQAAKKPGYFMAVASILRAYVARMGSAHSVYYPDDFGGWHVGWGSTSPRTTADGPLERDADPEPIRDRGLRSVSGQGG